MWWVAEMHLTNKQQPLNNQHWLFPLNLKWYRAFISEKLWKDCTFCILKCANNLACRLYFIVLCIYKKTCNLYSEMNNKKLCMNCNSLHNGVPTRIQNISIESEKTWLLNYTQLNVDCLRKSKGISIILYYA